MSQSNKDLSRNSTSLPIYHSNTGRSCHRDYGLTKVCTAILNKYSLLTRVLGKRKIIIHKPPPSTFEVCKDPVSEVEQSQLAVLDPSGSRRRLFDPTNPDQAKVGDVLLATFKTGEPFSGVAMSIKQRGPATSVLLRNHLTRVGTEMQIKVFSPLVQSMEVAQKALKRKRRARLYYLRKPKHDVGSVQKVVDQYLRQRALLTGGKLGSQYGSRRPNNVKGKR